MSNAFIPGDLLADLGAVPPRPHPSTGTGNGAAKLNDAKVRAIRVAAGAGANLAHLATAFGISVRTARHIVEGTSWRHVR
ncbi:hypothetical protein ABT160_23630 [Streptomyces sp. NPDC001941]|uniref:hypothetical protein n=1 Tax=Streptomyces sp. NPDC001941 TaxID=3154659 RepID=UPI00332C7E84